MASGAPTAIPSGQAAPVEAITATQHGAWVVIATALGLVLGLTCIFIRVYVRVVITPPFGRDDYMHAIATAVAFIQSVVVFWTVSRGFGTSIELVGANLRQVQQGWVASDILYLLVLYLSKCSMLLLFLRLTPNKIQNKAAYGTLGFSTIWVIASAFMIATNCELNRPWPNIANQCSNMFVRWEIVTIIDIIIEVVLVVLAAVLVHDLKMSLSRKSMVIVAFMFRLPLIALVLLRLHYLGRGIHSPNPTLDLVSAVVWGQIEMHYSIVSNTVPCLRPFMMAVSTDYGATEPRTALGTKAYGYGSQNRKDSDYALNSMGSRNGPKMTSENNPGMFSKARLGVSRLGSSSNGFRSGGSNNKSTVTHQVSHLGHHDSNSIESNDSRKMIIRKEVDFKVEHGTVDTISDQFENRNQTDGHGGHDV